jgi:methionine aminopeptidase
MLTSLEPFISAQDEVAVKGEKKKKKEKEKEKGASRITLNMQYLPLSLPQGN